MCPNCILNQVGFSPGLWVAFGVCAVFFVAAAVAMWWAYQNGEFDDIEGSKFEMMDDEVESSRAHAAREHVPAARAGRVDS